jgi:hypothetical protein
MGSGPAVRLLFEQLPVCVASGNAALARDFLQCFL